MTTIETLWQKSRSGAWAGRGFRYQDAVTAHILIGAWSGACPGYTVTPEGFDDIELQEADSRLLVQVKSKAATARPFSRVDLAAFQSALVDRASKLDLSAEQTMLVVERATADTATQSWESFDGTLSGSENHFRFDDVEARSIELLTKELGCLPSVATLLFHTLVRFVGVLSDANGSASLEHRVSASVSDTARVIADALRNIDPSSLQHALRERICEPIDIHTPLPAPGFYRGVDVVPGHLAAGLVFDRPDDVEQVRKALLQRRAALIAGPSGAGKSALQWLTVSALRHGMRWFQVGFGATANDLTAIRDLISGLQPSLHAPVGLVLDDVGRSQSDLWLGLERTLLAQPGMLLLGSIREEDTALVSQSANHARISVGLTEPLAESLWNRLREEGQCHWLHWREPFEKAQGLLLEYVHTLTEGERLDGLIHTQVARREQEGRFHELAILRLASCAAYAGASVDVERLTRALSLTGDQYRVAAKRLIAEHLLREASDGSLHGLHQLRSAAILRHVHASGAETISASAAAALQVIAPHDITRYLAIAVEQLDVSDAEAAKVIAEQFVRDSDLPVIVKGFAGFGILTLADAATQWVEILRAEAIEPAHWWLATILVNAGGQLPDGDGRAPVIARLNAAIARTGEISVSDRRILLAQALTDTSAQINLNDAAAADELFSNLAPMALFPAVPVEALPLRIDMEVDLDWLFPMLESAYAVDAGLAADMVEALGGEQRILDYVFASTPWITQPTLGAIGKFDLAAQADRYCVTGDADTQLNDEIVAVCKKLIAAAPRADGAVVRALTATGDELAWPGFGSIASKAMPRKNLPADATVRWNQVFAQSVVARGAAPSETEFAQGTADLLERTATSLEKIVRLFARDKIPLLKQEDLNELDAIAREANAFSAALPPQLSGSHKPVRESLRVHHPAPLMAAALCGDILPRILRYDRSKPNRGIASSISEQLDRLKEVCENPLWRLTEAPPTGALDRIRRSLETLLPAVSELVFAESSYLSILRQTRKLLPSKAPTRLAKSCQSAGDQRLEAERDTLQAFLSARGIEADVHAVPVPSRDCAVWPPARLCALVETDDLLHFFGMAEQLDLGESGVMNGREIILFPYQRGTIIKQFGLQFRGGAILPTVGLATDWIASLGRAALQDEWLDRFHVGAEAAVQLATIAAVRNLDALHQAEAEVFDQAKRRLEDTVEAFLEAQDGFDDERFTHASTIIATMEAALRGEEWATEHMSDIDAVGADFIRGDIAQTTTYVVFAQCQLIDWALDGRGKSTRIRKGAHNE